MQSYYGEDYGKGAEVIYSIFFGILAGYWVVLVAYVAYKAKSGEQEKEDEDLIKVLNE